MAATAPANGVTVKKPTSNKKWDALIIAKRGSNYFSDSCSAVRYNAAAGFDDYSGYFDACAAHISIDLKMMLPMIRKHPNQFMILDTTW